MKRCCRLFACSLLVGLLSAAPSFAQNEEELKKDLSSVIALQGLPCGEVVAVKVQAQNDYLASCKDGNRYHVYENDKGRVIVEKQ
jgi:hypothetical protein